MSKSKRIYCKRGDFNSLSKSLDKVNYRLERVAPQEGGALYLVDILTDDDEFTEIRNLELIDGYNTYFYTKEAC